MTFSHSFVVVAYGSSKHLEDCLSSLSAQTTISPIVISTSTPFTGIDKIAERFGARLHIHGPNRGIGPDWNAALDATDTDLVTLAHQDDCYLPEFTTATVETFSLQPEASFTFCDNGEIHKDGRLRSPAWNNRIKQWLIAAASYPSGQINSPLRRRILLGFGNPIICTSVTLNRRQCRDFHFQECFYTNMDWLAWLQLSKTHPIMHINKRLVTRRIHEDSATSKCIVDGTRLAEDRLVFGRIWPRPVATLISLLYRLSYFGYNS
ncbi:Glycosyltransferase involved in cell wall bisynthesis [Pseudoxanthomonas sp. GM95]|nr:Glycosyltransferase involved in cell wall bisynthesis [Pseudoxanthomonas sp. GM95]